MSPLTSVCISIASLVALLSHTAASQNLRAASSDVVSRDRVVEQLRSLLGHGHSSERIAAVEELLRPTYKALPKDARGSLDHRGARYALYRYFLVEHGWHVKGLSLDVEEKGTASPADMLKSKMPSFIIEVLEQQMGSNRLGLGQLAVLAATIEDLVHSDAVDSLELAYKTHGFSTGAPLESDQADLVLRTFALYFLLPFSQEFAANATRITLLATQDAQRHYSGWDDAMLWLEDVKHGLEYEARSALRPFAFSSRQLVEFNTLARWATATVDGFGRFSDIECKGMKNNLLDLEGVEREDGRVGLAKFYAPYMAGGSHHFSESPAYLRHLGALDEHDARQPSVIVPNVLYAKSQCLATSGFHAVCCIDDCEVLMSGLEQRLLQPKAAAAQIAEVVSSMSSDTVAAPRNLSAPLRSRLDEIAGRHGGSVPLHSRLFAQWMHYAFPNECPYPRSLLTSETQLTGREWRAMHKQSTMASKHEMRSYAEQAQSRQEEVSESLVMLWSEDEELLSDLLETSAPGRGLLSSVFRCVAGCAALVATAFAIYEVYRSERGESCDKGCKKGSQPWFGRAAPASENRAHFV